MLPPNYEFTDLLSGLFRLFFLSFQPWRSCLTSVRPKGADEDEDEGEETERKGGCDKELSNSEQARTQETMAAGTRVRTLISLLCGLL